MSILVKCKNNKKKNPPYKWVRNYQRMHFQSACPRFRSQPPILLRNRNILISVHSYVTFRLSQYHIGAVQIPILVANLHIIIHTLNSTILKQNLRTKNILKERKKNVKQTTLGRV